MTDHDATRRFEDALRRFDEANAADPHHEVVDGRKHPRELLYARRLYDWVLRLRPDASEPLRLAARCQHLRRWMIPRDTYPEGRAGYLRWRRDLKAFHARESGEILRQAGYDDATVARVQSLNLKQDLGRDADCQTLEDALCLVFLEHQLPDLARRTEAAKLVNALRKSWDKMSDQGRTEALRLRYGETERRLLDEALSGPTERGPSTAEST